MVDEGRYASGVTYGAKTYDELFRKIITLFNSGKVIITDGLHASIFSFLMHKPHIVLDQEYKKINHTRSTAFKFSKTCQDKELMRYDQADSIEEAVQMAAKMITMYQ